MSRAVKLISGFLPLDRQRGFFLEYPFAKRISTVFKGLSQRLAQTFFSHPIDISFIYLSKISFTHPSQTTVLEYFSKIILHIVRYSLMDSIHIGSIFQVELEKNHQEPFCSGLTRNLIWLNEQ